MRKLSKKYRYSKKHNVSYDFEPGRNLVYRTAIYLSRAAAVTAEVHLKKYWDKVQRVGFIVFASRKDANV